MHHSRFASRSGTFDSSKSSVDESLRVVDISNQYLTRLPSLVIENRERIEHLILDGNRFNEHSLNIPLFANLVTLSLNSNRVQNVGILLERLRKQCPKLTFLSLIGNPGWPHPVSTTNFLMYSSYRKLTADYLPELKFLDSTVVDRRIRKSTLSESKSRKNITGNVS